MRPLTETIAKAMLEVAGEPFIAHQLRLLKREGVSSVVLCLGYLGEQVVEFVGDGARYGLEVRASFDGPALLGTGGALRRALHAARASVSSCSMATAISRCADARGLGTGFAPAGLPALMTRSSVATKGRWDTSNRCL